MAALLAVSFSACSSNDSGQSSSGDNDSASSSSSSVSTVQESSSTSETEGSDNTSSIDYEEAYSLSKVTVPEGAGTLLKTGLREFLDKLDGDKFNFQYTIECLTESTEGKVKNGKSTVIRDGDKLLSIFEADDIEGGVSKQIVKDNKAYLIDDKAKKVTWTSVDSGVIPAYIYSNLAGGFYISSLELCGSGKETINGKEYDYEEYKEPESESSVESSAESSEESSSSNENVRARYYFDNGSMVGLKHTNNDYYYTTMIIEINKNIPDGSFDYPAEYTLEESSAESETSE